MLCLETLRSLLLTDVTEKRFGVLGRKNASDTCLAKLVNIHYFSLGNLSNVVNLIKVLAVIVEVFFVPGEVSLEVFEAVFHLILYSN